MITIVKPDKLYKPDLGDVLWGAAADWAAPSPEDDPDPMRVCGLQLNVAEPDDAEHKVVFLSVVNPNPFRAARALGIDIEWFAGVRHTDPYTEQPVYGVVPTALLTNDTKKYRNNLLGKVPYIDLALDSDYWKEMRRGVEFLEPSDIARLFLGSGYSEGCSIHDGGHELKPAKLKLSNGDWLYVWFWEWYNK
jgi:hypothetical protein